MTRLRYAPVIAAAALLGGSLVALYLTRDTGAARIVSKQNTPAGQGSLVDARLLETARRAAALADTADEQDLAREALRLADRELDQAFATALRVAADAKAPTSGPLQQLAAAVAQAKARVAADRDRIAQFTAAAETKDSAAEQLQLAKAQLALDEDELDDAQENLARSGGDKRATIERELQAHDAVQHETVSMPKIANTENPSTLKEGIEAWSRLGRKEGELAEARRQAAGNAALLDYQYDLLGQVQPPSDSPASAEMAADGSGDTAAVVERLRRLSDQTKTLADLNKRAAGSQQLADVYGRWMALVEVRRRAVLHSMLGSVAAILAVLLAALLAVAGVRRALGHRGDRGRLHQLRVMATIAVQLAAAFLVLLIVFGPPTQMTTMIGLLTAGLTVVLKDFIVAFFGWFVLMGRNGIRVGDWVEIQGVGGEVVEIGLLRTVLLEMGNWAATGHPTGRRVAFVNSFAIERHYFNFSTAGQWLWDELQVALPAGGDPYATTQRIREAVERETAGEAAQAEQEWERVTHQYGMQPFSAKPAVSLRPAAGGLEAVVRYITRAPRRFEVKSQLFREILELLRKPEEAAPNQA